MESTWFVCWNRIFCLVGVLHTCWTVGEAFTGLWIATGTFETAAATAAGWTGVNGGGIDLTSGVAGVIAAGIPDCFVGVAVPAEVSGGLGWTAK